jgi:hypothetical protein
VNGARLSGRASNALANGCPVCWTRSGSIAHQGRSERPAVPSGAAGCPDRSAAVRRRVLRNMRVERSGRPPRHLALCGVTRRHASSGRREPRFLHQRGCHGVRTRPVHFGSASGASLRSSRKEPFARGRTVQGLRKPP